MRRPRAGHASPRARRVPGLALWPRYDRDGGSQRPSAGAIVWRARGHPMARLSLTLLGGFRAMLGSRELVVPLRKARAMLGYLALYPGQPHTRAKLATLLW